MENDLRMNNLKLQYKLAAKEVVHIKSAPEYVKLAESIQQPVQTASLSSSIHQIEWRNIQQPTEWTIQQPVQTAFFFGQFKIKKG